MPSKNVTFEKCALTHHIRIDPVWGAERTEYSYCETQRQYSIGDHCGPEAKHFEAREVEVAA